MKKILALIFMSVLIVSCQTSESPVPTGEPIDSDSPVVSDPDQPIPVEPDGGIGGGKDLVRGSIYINITELLIMESYPIQVMLSLSGDLPTPCDVVAYVIEEPNDENKIHVDVHSLGEEGMICIQVLEPFEENISISSLDTQLDDGVYTVWVNGELVGEFNYPGG